MFERFTERARLVVVLAQEEARSAALMHNYIGTEHMLLGLLRVDESLAARVLESFDVSTERVRAQILRMIGPGEELTSGQIPFTPRAKATLEAALTESRTIGHSYVGTEHILLGLIRDRESVATRILRDCGAAPEQIRAEVTRMLATPHGREHSAAATGRPRPEGQARTLPERRHAPVQPAIDPGWLGVLAELLAPLGPEIRAQLRRAPDVGDLLLACACVPHTAASSALEQLGIDVDQLQALVERSRAQRETDRDELARRMLQTTQAKEKAIEDGRLEEAARRRDHERVLRRQAQTPAREQRAALGELRHHLGLPDTTTP